MAMMVPRGGCPTCSSIDSHTLYRCSLNEPPLSTFLLHYFGRKDISDFPQGDYRIEECLRCGTLWQAEVGEDEFLTRVYGEWLDFVSDPEAELPDYRFDVRHPALSRDGHELMSAASFHGKKLGEMVTFDFGMGWASWARIAASLGCRSYGSDLSDNRMAYAARFGVNTITLAEAEGIGADFINMEQVLEHVIEPQAIVASLVKALSPGGILKIGVPQPAGVKDALRDNRITMPDIMPLQPIEHVDCFNEAALHRLGRAHRLEPVRPGLASRYAYLARGGLSPRFPRNTLKEAIRPFYTFRNKRMLTVWLQRRA